MNASINTSYIKLDSFLKMINAVSSGGEAKIVIAEGEVSVNGLLEIRRGRKLYPGDRICFRGGERVVKAA
ncbi:MAG: RNA-binding S4 domain-containing protein [Desulfuromonadales bacterium]